jgi:2-phosphoglycolate phosphatase
MSNFAKSVLFDLDGTLIDTASDMTEVLLTMINKHHGDLSITNDIARNYVSDGSIGLIKIGFPLAPKTKIKELQKIYLKLYQENLCIKSNFFHSLEKLLDDLTKNQIQWGIVTNKPTRMTLPLLIALKRFSPFVISGDTIKERKPSPLPLILACKMMNIQPENVIYVGDAERDIIAGRAARMKTVLAQYGYIKRNDRPSEWNADLTAKTPEDLSKIIRSKLNLCY